MATSRAQVWPNSKQAKKGIRSGHPEIMVECPQCHSPAGRTCFMAPGYWGVAHTVRKARYRELSLAAAAATPLTVPQ
jgi:hypothetical protein